MKVEKCSHCDFNIRRNEMFCPDCGKKTIHYERDPLDIFNMQFLKNSAVLSFYVFLALFTLLAALTIITILSAGNTLQYLFDSLLLMTPVWLLLSTVTSLILCIILFYFPKTNKMIGLRLKSETINDRLANIDTRQIEIDDILRDIKTDETSNLQDVQTKLLTAKEILDTQRIKYKLQQDKIELVRLQNDVSPFLFEFQNLKDDQLDDGLTIIGKTKDGVISLRQKVLSESKKDLPETEQFVEQLTETEYSYSKLREAIIRKQATNAVDELSPITDYLQSENADEVAFAIETFNANVELSLSEDSFNKLENEYQNTNSKFKLSE